MNGTRFACKLCSQKFDKPNQYFTHLENDHQESKIWPCGKCNDDFSNIADLRKHISRHNFACKRCGKLSAGKRAYESHERMHKRRMHTTKKRHSCNTCDLFYESMTALKALYKKQHPEGNELLPPKSCGSDSTSTYGASNIKRQEGLSQKLCGVCRTSDDLNPNPNEPAKVIFCDNCDKSYHFSCVHLVEEPDKWLCLSCDVSLKHKVASLLEEYHSLGWDNMDKEVTQCVRRMKLPFAPKLLHFFQELADEGWCETHDPLAPPTAQVSTLNIALNGRTTLREIRPKDSSLDHPESTQTLHNLLPAENFAFSPGQEVPNTSVPKLDGDIGWNTYEGQLALPTWNYNLASGLGREQFLYRGSELGGYGSRD